MVNEKNRKIAKQLIKDLNKFKRKINHLMFATIKGQAPQILKLILTNKLFEHAVNNWKKENDEEKYRIAEEYVDFFIEKDGGIKSMAESDLGKYLYENERPINFEKEETITDLEEQEESEIDREGREKNGL